MIERSATPSANESLGEHRAGCLGCACERRNLLIASGALGGAAELATAVPFVSSFAPSERARSPGAPVEVDISALPPGKLQIVEDDTA